MGGIRQSTSGLVSVSKYQFFIKVFSWYLGNFL
jgi:hypothetical protein